MCMEELSLEVMEFPEVIELIVPNLTDVFPDGTIKVKYHGVSYWINGSEILSGELPIFIEFFSTMRKCKLDFASSSSESGNPVAMGFGRFGRPE